jgi:hypothetical protein
MILVQVAVRMASLLRIADQAVGNPHLISTSNLNSLRFVISERRFPEIIELCRVVKRRYERKREEGRARQAMYI